MLRLNVSFRRERSFERLEMGGRDRLVPARSGLSFGTKKAGRDNIRPASGLINDYFFAPQLELPAVETIVSFSTSVIRPAATKSTLVWATLRT